MSTSIHYTAPTIPPYPTFSCGHTSTTLPKPKTSPKGSPNTTPPKPSPFQTTDYPIPCRACAYNQARNDEEKAYSQSKAQITSLEGKIVRAKNEQLSKVWEDEGIVVVERELSRMRGDLAECVIMRGWIVRGIWREFEKVWGEV